MRLASHVRRLLADRGLVVSRRQSLRFGVDELLDVGRLVSHVRVVFDVGANDGATALAFARAFPRAHVYAFEPVPSTFAALERATAGVPRITGVEMALGAEEGEATIRLTGHGLALVSVYTDAIWSNRFARGNALFVRTAA